MTSPRARDNASPSEAPPGQGARQDAGIGSLKPTQGSTPAGQAGGPPDARDAPWEPWVPAPPFETATLTF